MTSTIGVAFGRVLMVAFLLLGISPAGAEPIDRLEVVKGKTASETIRIPPAKDYVATIGRSAANDIVFGDPTVSRRHATIRCHQRECRVEDTGTEGQGSTNGTLVNKKNIGRRQSVPLRRNDVIELGPDAHVVAR